MQPSTGETKKFVAFDRDAGRYYRGSKLWRWTRFRSQAAFLTRNRLEQIAEEQGWKAGSILLFDAPKDRWPRGRFSGQRIVGVRIVFLVHVDFWNWCPVIKAGLCKYVGWLCFSLNWELNYSD